jgi:hypothetical protein
MNLYTYPGMYSVDLCRANPDYIFLFGDNLQRYGKAGQAVIRDEPNAYGIATKHAPGRKPSDYFTDLDLCWVQNELDNMDIALDNKLVIVPVLEKGLPSLGCGLADLPNRAPECYKAICRRFDRFAIALGSAPAIWKLPFTNQTPPEAGQLK